MKIHPIFLLPEHRLGPYRMRAVPASRDMFTDKRRKIENDWTAGVTRIDSSLSPAEVLRYFLRHLVTAIHYRSGLNDRSNEESFTHSLASGFVELARRTDQRFWVGFQDILARELAPGAAWAQTVRGIPSGAALAMPATVTYRGRECRLTWIAHAACEKASVYGYYCNKNVEVELSDGLRGANLALVGLHEVVHFLHACEGLGDRTTDAVFRSTQVRMLMRFWKENPNFWQWWLSVARPARRSLPVR